MTYNELARKIAKAEGKKQELSIAQIKEVLSILSDLCVESILSPLDVVSVLVVNGAKRAKKNKN